MITSFVLLLSSLTALALSFVFCVNLTAPVKLTNDVLHYNVNDEVYDIRDGKCIAEINYALSSCVVSD